MFREDGERRASVGITGLAGPGAAAAAAHGRWRWLRLFFSVIWLVYLAQPLSNLSHLHHGALWMAAAASVTAAFCAVFVAVVISWDHRPVLARRALILLVALAAVISLLFLPGSNGQNVVWIYVSSAAGWVIPDRRAAIRTVLGIAVCFLLFSWLAHDGVSDMLITLIPVVFVGITMAGIRVQIGLMRELAAARETVAMLAASEERLRLARDMHDLTGQSLSTITLKSELAARLLRRLPAGPDRDRVADEIQQVAGVSRQTLHDIREAISGYRRPTLAVEIITARSALDSAGITVHDDPQLTLVSGTVDPDAEAALAWCLREAVTNVIRHSGAENCYLSLTRRGGELSLEVRDDGRGRPAGGPADTSGTGLHGMAERLCAVGGHLELRPDPPGFCLIAAVPAREPALGHAPAGASGHAPAGSAANAAAGITVTT
jgi:two-component system, NarL family, sensor histidine kinase DesK